MSGVPPPVAEYVDGNGNTWQLTAEMAKRLGYKPVGKAAKAEQVETKVVETPPAAKPTGRRTAATK